MEFGRRSKKMKMIKQRPLPHDEVAMDYGVCTIAMLADLTYEKVLADNPNYREITDYQWMRYLQSLGFQVDEQDKGDLPIGMRLYCGVTGCKDGVKIVHAVAVDESGRIFDPANGAPEPGKHTLKECVDFDTFAIRCCFAVRDRHLM
jgi:hypothetical protein